MKMQHTIRRFVITIIPTMLLMNFVVQSFSMTNEPKIPAGWDRPVIKVAGKIIFQSNRGNDMSEMWLIKNGDLTKIVPSLKSTSDIPKELTAPYRGLLANAFVNLSRPIWSLDGKRIICADDGEVVIYDENGTLLEKIKPSKYAQLVDWSSDSKFIYFVGLDAKPDQSGAYNIFRLNLANHTEERITTLDPLPGRRRILSMSVSPVDGAIAFTVYGEKKYGISIWMVSADGSGLELIIKYADDPSWSADGSQIVYSSSYLPDGKTNLKYGEIFTFDLTTRQTTRITNNGWNDRNPVFSPDGQQIAFESYRHVGTNHGSEIFVINVDGTGEARLTTPHQNPKYKKDIIRSWATDQHPDWTS